MSNPFLGEIRMFGGNFAPKGWAMCNGQILSIAQNTALFSLLGTTYGGNGVSTFALPDLRGRVPLHLGQGPGLSNYTEGQQGGSENVTLLLAQMPAHNHTISGVNSGGNQAGPANGSFAVESTGTSLNYANSSAPPISPMNPAMLSQTGQSQPHNNQQPYLCINFIIALVGIFPSRN
jgi:microcystin-dependent protein